MRVIVTGGGSGGHIYPAIAIAEKIKEKEPDSEILYIGNDIGIEKDIVPDLGYNMKLVPARWKSKDGNKLHLAVELVKTGFVSLAGAIESRRIIKKFKPDAVIGTGGFVCVPVIYAAGKSKVKTFIHEQNAFPGKANRFLEQYVDAVFLGFDKARDMFKDKSKLVTVGNPVRSQFYNVDKTEARKKLGLPEDDFIAFSFGGSQGAETINDISIELIKRINNRKGITFVFGTGSLFYEEVEDMLKKEKLVPGDNIHIKPYIKDMADHIGAADLIISRAGALSLAEITVCGKPSILVPLSTAADNHQYYNALSIVEKGGAYLVDETDIDLDKVVDSIMELSEEPEVLKAMSIKARECAPMDATEKIYEEIKKRVK